MSGSPVFSINLIYLRIPTNSNYHMSIKKSQVILKRFIDLKFSVWFTLSSENETMFRDTSNFFQLPLSSFLFPLSPFPTYVGKIEATLLAGQTAGHLVFWQSWTAVDLEKVQYHKTLFRFLHSVNQTLNLRSTKCFRIAWLFLIDIW